MRQVLNQTDLPCADGPYRDTEDADAEADPLHPWDVHAVLFSHYLLYGKTGRTGLLIPPPA